MGAPDAWRRLGHELYQAQVRYTSSTRVPFRIDAGGAGFARGRYRAAAASAPALDATVFTLEAEYAIGYTKVSGEWIVDRFDTTW